MTERYEAIVVGAGIGGMMSAAILAKKGKRVLVVEATDRIGGFQRRFAHEGFQIEPHFHFLQDLAPGRPMWRILQRLDIDLEWRLVEPLAQLTFPDRVVPIPNDRNIYIKELQRDFPKDTAGITDYFAATQLIYEAVKEMPPTITPALLRYGADTFDEFASRFVEDPHLRTILGCWAAYYGYGTHQIGALPVAAFTENLFDGGVRQPVGGIAALFNSLREVVESNNGAIVVSTPVERIIVKDRQVEGVRLAGGTTVQAPAVVSNASPLATLRDLAQQRGVTIRRLEKTAHFRSPFTIYVGVQSTGLGLQDKSPVQITYPSYDTEAQDRAQLEGRIEDAPVSLGIPTIINPQLAPEGHDLIMTYTFMTKTQIDALLTNPEAARSYAERLVKVAGRGLPGLQERVVAMTHSIESVPSIYAPTTKGALGWAPTPQTLLGGKAVVVALHNRVGSALARRLAARAPGVVNHLAGKALPGAATPIRGLFLAGQWTQMGPGMSCSSQSAQVAADLIT